MHPLCRTINTKLATPGQSALVTTTPRYFASNYKPNVPYPVKPNRKWQPVAPPKEKVFQEISEEEKLAKEREEHFEEVRRSTADDFNLDFDLDRDVVNRSRNLQQKLFSLIETPEEQRLNQLQEDELFQRLVRAKIKEEALKERHERLAAEAEEKKRLDKAFKPKKDVDPKEPQANDKHRSFSIVSDRAEKHDGTLSDEMRNMYVRAYSEAFPDKAATLDDMVKEGRQLLLTKFKIARGELDPSQDIRVTVDSESGVIEPFDNESDLSSTSPNILDPNTSQDNTQASQPPRAPSPNEFEDFFAADYEEPIYRPAFPHMRVEIDPRMLKPQPAPIDPRTQVPQYKLEKPPKEYVNEALRDRSKTVHLAPGDEGYVDPFERFDGPQGNVGIGDIKLAKEKGRLFEQPADYVEYRRKEKERMRMREEALEAAANGYTGDIRELLHPDDRGIQGKDGVYYSKPLEKMRPEYGLHMAEGEADDMYNMMMFHRLERLNEGHKEKDKFDVWEEFKKWENKKEEKEEKASQSKKDASKEEPKVNLDEDWGKDASGQPDGAIPKSAFFKSPMDYINRFIMRVHSDLFHGDSAMIIDDKSQFAFNYHNKGQDTGSFEGVIKDTVGVQVNNDRAKQEEYESGHFTHPDNIRYYKLSIDFIREHNMSSLSKLNTVLDYHKSLTAMTEVEQADPYANHSANAPQRTVFTFFCRSRRGAPYARPNPAVIHPIEAPWNDPHAKPSVTAENNAETESADAAVDGADAVQAKNSGKFSLAGKDSPHIGEVDEDEDVEGGKSKKKVKRPLKYVEIEEEELAEMPHFRMVRVKFRPPKNPHAKTTHFDSKKSVSEMHVAVDRLLVELLMNVEDEIPAQDMERWKRGIKQHRDRKAWLQNKQHLNEFNAMFKKDKGYTVHGVDEKEEFLNSPMAFMHMFPHANRHHEKIYKEANHPKKHLFKAMMRGGCINFDKSLAADMKLIAAQQLNAFIQHGYNDFQCKKWWSRRMTEIELMEKRGNAKHLGQDDDNPDNVVFNMGHDPEREELWPDPAQGYGFKLHCAVHFLPANTFFEPRIVSSNYKLKLAYRKSTFKDAMFMSLLENNGYELEEVTPSTVEIGAEKEHIQNKSIVVPTAYSDICLELYVPHNVRVDEFDEYVQDAYLRMAEWERLMRLHVQEKVILKNLGLIEDAEDGADGLGNDTGAWLRKLIQNPKARVDAEIMPHTHALVQFYREQMQRAMSEDSNVGYSNVFGDISATQKYSKRGRKGVGVSKADSPYGNLATPDYDGIPDGSSGLDGESDFEAAVFGDDSEKEDFDYEALMSLYDPLARDNVEVLRTAYEVLSKANAEEELVFGDEVDEDDDWSLDNSDIGEKTLKDRAMGTPLAGLAANQPVSMADPVAILHSKLAISDSEHEIAEAASFDRFDDEDDVVRSDADNDEFAGYDVFVEEEIASAPETPVVENNMTDTTAKLQTVLTSDETQQQAVAEPHAATPASANASAPSVFPPKDEKQKNRALEAQLESLLSSLYIERGNLQKAIVGLNKTKQLTQHVDIVRAYKRVLDLIKDKELELAAVRRVYDQLESKPADATSPVASQTSHADNEAKTEVKPPKRVGILAREIQKKRLLKHQDKVKQTPQTGERTVPPEYANVSDEEMFGPRNAFETFDSPLHPAYVARIHASMTYSPYLNAMLIPNARRVDEYGKDVMDILAKHEKREYDRTHASENHVARLLMRASNTNDETNIYKKLDKEKTGPQHGGKQSMVEALDALASHPPR